MKTAIAKSAESLDDLLSSDICEDAKIYCCFPLPKCKLEQVWIQRKVDKINIHSVMFSDKKEIKKK